ncbi:MAG TPA: DUF805 domain-containing protein [Caulobacter sp.]|nr:DUF805 domain-containing protein [Caulobacter sp.]
MTLWRKLFGVSGRIRRRDYWLLTIGSTLALTVLDVVASAILGGLDSRWPANPVSWILWLVSMWIGIALLVKRLHDRNKGPIWILVFMIPVIGWIWCLVEMGFLDGTPGPNRYGPSPKGVVATQAEVVEVFE